jgi:hypothetical protein
MKKISMKPSVLFGLAFLMVTGAACLDTETAAPEGTGDLVIRENHPFHVAVFDHVPTEDEVRADLARFLMAAHDKPDITALTTPTGFILPQPGQKLVRIDAATSNIANAGTDRADKVQFTGVWQAGTGQQFPDVFVLDNPNRNDLNQNTLSIFYYLLDVDQHVPGLVQDRFLRGQISNSSSDGWHCSSITLAETNHAATTRVQSLPFNQWVDYPSPATSSWLLASNSSWLDYY